MLVFGAEQSPQIKQILDESIKEHQLPGLIAAVTDQNGVKSIGCTGVRSIGRLEKIALSDRFHIGSCTKAMTAVLIGVLVDKGKMKWDDTLVDVIPELKPHIHADYHKTTLWQLLTHRGAFPANAKNWWAFQEKPLRQRRISILKDSLSAGPQQKLESYLYSNLSYMAAGVMAERVCDENWEQLMQRYVFKPLNMNNCGFGPPGTKEKRDQPLGHVLKNQQWQAHYADNAEALGPAGRVHCSVGDWAKFLRIFLTDSQQQLLKNETIKKLMTPSGTYAGGWVIAQRTWAKGLTLSHTGTNTMWYANVWVAPKTNRCYLSITNSCNKDSHNICDQIIGKLIKLDSE